MKDVDWAKLTGDLLEGMVYTQSGLAEQCMVTQQSISNWKNGLRSPGGFARKKLFELMLMANMDKSRYLVDGIDQLRKEIKKTAKDLPEDVAEFAFRLSQCKKKKRTEIIAMADFLLNRN
jgi:transcriptional regulator with XRE-family HTH domain